MFFLKKYLVYKKFTNLYFDDYKGYKIVFNTACNDHSLVVLDDEQWEIFNLIDGKLNVNSIIKKLNNKIPKEYIIDTLRYLIYRNIIYNRFNSEKKPLKYASNFFNLSIELSSACNLACDYCFLDKTNGKLIDFENAKKYLEKGFQIQKNNKGRNFNLRLSGGEPLLNFDTLVKLVEFANKNYKKYKIEEITYSLVTNGTLINENVAKTLKELNIGAALSLDGLDDYCLSRKYTDGSNAFNEIIKGYKHLKDYDVNFAINIVINPLNVKGLPQIIEFLAKDRTAFSMALMMYSPLQNPDFDFNIPELKKGLKEAYTFIRENLEKYPVFEHCNLLYNIDVKRARIYTCSLENGYGIGLNTDGYAYGCNTIDGSYGHIFDKDFEKKIKEKNKEKKYNVSVEEKENCKDCQWKYVCTGDCPMSTWNKYKTTRRESPLCEVIKEMIPELLKIEAEKDLIQRKQGVMC